MRGIFGDSRGFPQGPKLNSTLFVTRSSSSVRAIVLFLWRVDQVRHGSLDEGKQKASIVGDNLSCWSLPLGSGSASRRQVGEPQELCRDPPRGGGLAKSLGRKRLNGAGSFSTRAGLVASGRATRRRERARAGQARGCRRQAYDRSTRDRAGCGNRVHSAASAWSRRRTGKNWLAASMFTESINSLSSFLPRMPDFSPR
jgi:hypothetical protein